MVKKEVAETSGGDLAIPTDWQAQMAAKAQEGSATVRPSSSVISLRSGIVSYQDVQAPNNELPVVFLAFAQEHTYYDTEYDPDNPSSPTCYSIGEAGTDPDEMIPATNVEDPQADVCGDCPQFKWGSANKGRGKACQQRFKLLAIPATALESAEAILSAEVATVKLPVTSGKVWAAYVQKVATLQGRPIWGVVTTISAKPDPKTQFKASFVDAKLVDFEASPELYMAIQKKIEMSSGILFQGYEPPSDKDDEPTKDNKKLA